MVKRLHAFGFVRRLGPCGFGLQTNPGFAAAHNNLVLALVEQGKVSATIQYFQQALTPATAQTSHALAEAIRIEIKLDQSPLPQPHTP